MGETGGSTAEAVAERYYDSRDADAFYRRIWGGEDIHIGLYERPDDAILDASRRTVERMAARLCLGPESRVIDLGAGYGGAARHLVRRFGCRVTCLNLSEMQNAYNRERCREEGLEDRIRVLHGSFEEVPAESREFDVAWSQDAFLHGGNRRAALSEARRVLVPGRDLIFTDPMQADACPPGVLQPVYDRLELDSLASPGGYRKLGAELGLELRGFEALTPHLRTHYARVAEELRRRHGEMVERASRAYVDRMLEGLSHWVAAADRGHLAWGILHFRRT